jgi:hypothetical protein
VDWFYWQEEERCFHYIVGIFCGSGGIVEKGRAGAVKEKNVEEGRAGTEGKVRKPQEERKKKKTGTN